MKRITKILPALIISGLFIIGSLGLANAQMTNHMGMKAGIQKIMEGSTLLNIAFKLIDDKTLDLAKALPLLREGNKAIQEGNEMLNKAQQEMMEKRPMMSTKDPMRIKHLKMKDHKMMQPQDKKEQPKPETAEPGTK